MKISVIGREAIGARSRTALSRAGFEVAGEVADQVTDQVTAETAGAATATVEQRCHAPHEQSEAERWFDTHARPRERFTSEVYLLALATSQQVQKVLTGKEGLLRLAPPGSVIVDLCRGDVNISRELAVQTRLAGHHWLEAASSRDPRDESEGHLTLLVGGDDATVQRMTPLLEAIATRHLHVGDAGCGHAAVLANDYLHAAHLITTAEAIAMAYRAGVRPHACIDAINLGAGRSAVSEVNFPRWVLPGDYDSGISTGALRRDLRLARSYVTTLKLPSGLMKAVFDRWQPPELCPADEDDIHHLCDRWLSDIPAQLRHTSSPATDAPSTPTDAGAPRSSGRDASAPGRVTDGSRPPAEKA